ncbi:hypothetical protein ACFE04_008794 [Oxalis oulophora]
MDKVLNHHEIKATNNNNNNGRKTKPINNVDQPNVDEEEEDSESSLLLPPPRKGGLSRKSDSVRRNVQWKDNKGNKLVEILEYEPSEVSDSDDEEDFCMCIIM